jgi:hypothetical protein
MQTFKVWIDFQNETDTVVIIGGLQPPVTMQLADLVAQNAQFWWENDTNGIPCLCTNKIDGMELNITLHNGTTTYNPKVNLFVLAVSDTGVKHPVHRPK